MFTTAFLAHGRSVPAELRARQAGFSDLAVNIARYCENTPEWDSSKSEMTIKVMYKAKPDAFLSVKLLSLAWAPPIRQVQPQK